MLESGWEEQSEHADLFFVNGERYWCNYIFTVRKSNVRGLGNFHQHRGMVFGKLAKFVVESSDKEILRYEILRTLMQRQEDFLHHNLPMFKEERNERVPTATEVLESVWGKNR